MNLHVYSYRAKIAPDNFDKFTLFSEPHTLFGNIGGVVHICKVVTTK